MTDDIKNRMAQGAVWMVALRLSITALGFVSTVILARLLVPADFGLIALGTSLVAALDLLTSFRFDLVLIQNQAAARDEYDTAWTLNLLFGVALALLLCLGAMPAAHFYNEPRLTSIVYVLAAGALLDGLQNIGVVNFRKDMNYGREFGFMVSRKVAQVLVAGVCAFLLRSYWALAAGLLAGSVTALAASYLMHPYRPRCSLRAAGKLFGFSKWLVLDNALHVLHHRSADVIIGKLAGPARLGLFAMAYELATIAQNNVAAPIDRAMFPGYSRLAVRREEVLGAYLSASSMVALVALPVAIGASAIAPLLIPLLFGAKWAASIPVLQVLGIACGLSLLGAGTDVLYLSLGKPRLMLWSGCLYVVALLAAMAVYLPRWQLLGAAWAFFTAGCVTLPAQLWLLNRVLELDPRLWAARVWRPAAASAVMYLLVRELQVAMPEPDTVTGALLELSIVVGAGALCYVALVSGLWLMAGRPSGAERFLLSRVRA